jgi:hypothetical protein
MRKLKGETRGGEISWKTFTCSTEKHVGCEGRKEREGTSGLLSRGALLLLYSLKFIHR